MQNDDFTPSLKSATAILYEAVEVPFAAFLFCYDNMTDNITLWCSYVQNLGFVVAL